MKVIVIKSQDRFGYSWYNNLIGKVIDVVKVNSDNYWYGETNKFIKVEDCETLDEFRNKLIDKIIN